MRNLTLQGKIVIFKTIPISKIVFQLFIRTIPRHIINKIEEIQQAFMWKNASPKIKHETICNDYKTGGLSNFNIPNKIIAPQCSWITRIYDNSFREWKLIPPYLSQKSFCRSFKFYSNLLFKSRKAKFFPSFYR